MEQKNENNKQVKYMNKQIVIKKKKINPNLSLFSNKFINFLMIDGKKVKASKLFFGMLMFLKKKIELDSDKKINNLSPALLSNLSTLYYFTQAIQNVMPSLEVRKVRVSGTTYLVPAILSKTRQETLAIKWIIDSAKKKQKSSKLPFESCLADEIYDAFKKQGQARQKRDEIHRLAEANRAYVRYRWW